MKGRKGRWLNTTIVKNERIPKPCIKLKYCPYGQLVEEYPIGKKLDKLSCSNENGAIIQFGHDCPAHYLAEFWKFV
jgi:hypothetical protein